VDNVLSLVQDNPESTGSATFSSTNPFSRGMFKYDGLADISTQRTYAWAPVTLQLTVLDRIPLPFTVAISYSGSLCKTGNLIPNASAYGGYSCNSTDAPTGIYGNSNTAGSRVDHDLTVTDHWFVQYEEFNHSTVVIPRCSADNSDPPCFANGSIYYATLGNFREYPATPIVTNITVMACDPSVKYHPCSGEPAPAYTLTVSYTNSTFWVSPRGWGNSEDYLHGQFDSWAQESRLLHQWSHNLQEKLIYSWLNDMAVEHVVISGSTWFKVSDKIEDSIDATVTDNNGEEHSNGRIVPLSYIYGHGTLSSVTAELRIMSTWAEIFRDSYEGQGSSDVSSITSPKLFGANSNVGGVTRFFISTMRGSHMVFPGYDLLSFQGRCVGSQSKTTCGFFYEATEEHVFQKAYSRWIETRLQAQRLGNPNIDDAWVVMPPTQQEIDHNLVITFGASTTVGLDYGSRVWNDTLTTTSFPGGVIGVDMLYDTFTAMVKAISAHWSEYTCGSRLGGFSEVRCVLIDDSASIVMHPEFENPYWYPKTTFLGELEPRLTQVLTGIRVIEPLAASPQRYIKNGSLVDVRTVRFDNLPVNGSFKGRQSAEFYMVAVPHTNLALVVLIGYESSGNVGYCGLLAPTCPDVIFPTLGNMDFSVCEPNLTYYQVDESLLHEGHNRASKTGVPTQALTSGQLDSVMKGKLSQCIIPTTPWWHYFLIVLGCLLGLGAIIGGVVAVAMQEDTEEATEDASKELHDVTVHADASKMEKELDEVGLDKD